MSQPREQLGQAPQHAASCQYASERHRTDNQEHRIEHPRHASRGNQGIYRRIAGLNGGRAVERHGYPLAGIPKRKSGVFRGRQAGIRHRPYRLGLEDKGNDSRHYNRTEKRKHGRHFLDYQHARKHRNNQQPRGDMKSAFQCRGKSIGLRRFYRRMHQARHKENNQGNGERRHRSNHHIPDVGEKRGARRGRSQHRGIGQGGNLIAEISARHDCASRPTGVETLGNAYPYQGNADGRDGRPRASGHQRHQGAYHASRRKEYRRINDFQPVTNQGGHNAAHHPRASYRADKK